MIFENMVHEQTRDFVYPITRSHLGIRLRIGRNDKIKCTLVYWNRQMNEDNKSKIQMECYARDQVFDYYEVVIDTKEATRYIRYYFQIESDEKIIYLTYYGTNVQKPDSGFFEYLYTNEQDIFTVPTWINKSIFYQIFPERFCNGNPRNNDSDIEQWGSQPTRTNFMGGDLKGIIKKIPYLCDLGINAIYLNPIFESPSNHKYDTIDYFKIDPHFGTMNDFKQLVSLCHSKGIKVILDGVFNHCGYYSKQFQDVLEKGADSIYKDWFYIESYPVDSNNINYECVGYYKWMPKLKISNQEVREFILKVGAYWIEEADIDGWRLDVADEIDYTFWYEFRRTVKTIKPEAFILAETWKENREMLRGDQMDSVMNYVFRDAMVDFFAKKKITALEFDYRINRFLGVYQKQVHHSLFNIIDSHDTARFLTEGMGNINKLKLAVAFQMCFDGIPCVYYGDEIGMDGENDPDCRKAMEWEKNKQNEEIFQWYKEFIEIRKKHSSLQTGTFICNYCNEQEGVYGFIRRNDTECIYIVLNNSDTYVHIGLPLLKGRQNKEQIRDEITKKQYKVQPLLQCKYYNDDILEYTDCVDIELKPYQVCVLSKENF